MPFYENVFVARQDLTPAKVTELTNKFAAAIEAKGGKVTKREDWGLRNLAYKIQKNRKGHYTMLAIDAPATAVIEMERLMRLDENVLRHLTIKVDALEEGPSAMLEVRSKRQKDDKFEIEIEKAEV